MIHRESELTSFLDVPQISVKTSNAMLKKCSSEYWPSDRRKSVARDIVNNGKELLLRGNVDWDLVLSRISARKMDTVVFGDAAIAANGVRFIGGLAARAGWSMHNPQSVYLSGKYLVHIAGSELEDFKTTMTQAAISYAEKTIPGAELLMRTLDLLLEHRSRDQNGNLVNRIAKLLYNCDVQGAYNVVSSREDLVRRR